jgi:hypothetical protein
VLAAFHPPPALPPSLLPTSPGSAVADSSSPVDSRHEQRLIEVITDCFCSPTAGSAAAAENRRVVQALWQALTNAGVFEVSDLLHISAAILGHPTAHDDHREVWQSVQCASDLKHMWLIKFKQLVERLAKAAPAQATDATAATSTSTTIDAAARVEKLTDEEMAYCSTALSQTRSDSMLWTQLTAKLSSIHVSNRSSFPTAPSRTSRSSAGAWSMTTPRLVSPARSVRVKSQIRNRFRRCKSTGTVQLDLGNLLNHLGKQHPEQAPFPKEASPEHRASDTSTPTRTPAKSRKRNRTTSSASESPSSASNSVAASSSSSSPSAAAASSSSAPQQLSLLELLSQSHS